MQLSWRTTSGTYVFAANSVSVAYSTVNMMTRAGIPYCARVVVKVSGDLLDNAGTAALSADEQALRNALSVQFGDLIFNDNSGNPVSSSIATSQTISGLIVQDLAFPLAHGPAPEYVVIRSFNFTVAGDVPVSNAGALMIDFRETLTISGGMPYFVMKRAVNGAPQRQMIWPMTEYVLIQSGSATGYLSYPTPPPPKFPQWLKEAPRFSAASPDRTGLNYKDFTVHWEYHFESNTPAAFSSASPSLWPLSQ
jgi:hypothetical protein